MASEKPATVWQHDIYVPQSSRVISVRAYEGGLVSIAVAERTGPVVQALSIVLEGADRDEFDRAYQEACRRADGEVAAAETAEVKEGWGVIAPGTRKAHYYRETFSLCRTRGFYTGPLSPDDRPSPDDCKACRKALSMRERKPRGS